MLDEISEVKKKKRNIEECIVLLKGTVMQIE